MQKTLLLVAMSLFAVESAFAGEFYVAQNPTTKRCKILEEKPDGTKWVMVGTTSYPTLEAAKKAKRGTSECPKKKTDGEDEGIDGEDEGVDENSE